MEGVNLLHEPERDGSSTRKSRDRGVARPAEGAKPAPAPPHPEGGAAAYPDRLRQREFTAHASAGGPGYGFTAGRTGYPRVCGENENFNFHFTLAAKRAISAHWANPG